MVTRAWVLTRPTSGRIFGMGPNSLPQVYHTREEARIASRRLRDAGIETIVRSSDEATKAVWAVVREGRVIGNGVTSVPMVFKTRAQAREGVKFATELGYTGASVARLGAELV